MIDRAWNESRRWILGTLSAIALLVVVMGAAFGAGSSATAEDATPDDYVVKANRVVLASGAAPVAPGYSLALVSVEIPSGVSLDPHTHPGTQVALIVSGELTYEVLTGSIELHRAAEDGTPGPVIMIQAGETVVVEAGDFLVEQEGSAHQAANLGDEPVVIQISSLLKDGVPPATTYEGTPTV